MTNELPFVTCPCCDGNFWRCACDLVDAERCEELNAPPADEEDTAPVPVPPVELGDESTIPLDDFFAALNMSGWQS